MDGPMGDLIPGRVAIMLGEGCCPAHKCLDSLLNPWLLNRGSSNAGSSCNSCDNTKVIESLNHFDRAC